MRIVIVAVGKVKERGIREGIDEYVGRIRRYAKCDEVEFADASERELIPRFEKALSREGNLRPKSPRSRIIAMEVEGARYTSERFANVIGQCEIGAVPSVVFLIGGAYGLPKEISAKADIKLSLSDMILPHRLARLFLSEQIYRAFTILRGEPYSHA